MLPGIVALFVIAALSMFAPESIRSYLLERAYSPFWRAVASELGTWSPLPFAAAWVWVFVITYRRAGDKKRHLWWLFFLAPFVLCYPAWIAIILTCGVFFNWCGGPPL